MMTSSVRAAGDLLFDLPQKPGIPAPVSRQRTASISGRSRDAGLSRITLIDIHLLWLD
jgi:hypothetical protein